MVTIDTGKTTTKTNRGVLLKYVDKTKKNTSDPTSKYVTQQANQYINPKKMSK